MATNKAKYTKVIDGNIEVYKDENTNIVCVVNHDTKKMHASDIFQKEVMEEYTKQRTINNYRSSVCKR